jgi:hypothetical protein
MVVLGVNCPLTSTNVRVDPPLSAALTSSNAPAQVMHPGAAQARS